MPGNSTIANTYSCSINSTTPVENRGDNSSIKHEENGGQQDPKPELDIVINNVVCSFNVRCHLNLRDIALRGINVEYRKENGVSNCRVGTPAALLLVFRKTITRKLPN